MQEVRFGGTTPLRQQPTPDSVLFRAAQELEATFLAEMLKSARFGATPESFGGGAGESQFQAFMLNEQAARIARNGGIGLAESIFNALKEKKGDN